MSFRWLARVLLNYVYNVSFHQTQKLSYDHRNLNYNTGTSYLDLFYKSLEKIIQVLS
jgi:hypothetical protein